MKKVEELHPPVEEAAGDEAGEEAGDAAEVIDIEAKPEITFEDFGKCSSRWGRSSPARK